MDACVTLALEHGFSHAAVLDAATLTPLDAVRDMCATGACAMYGRCWTCPPACGSIAENAAQMARYSSGIIVQTTREMDDPFDYETMEECSRAHREQFVELCARLREEFSELLPLGAGGCRLCEACSYPDAPCRKPGEALSSMEAYGLLVSDVCLKNGLGYYYGEGTFRFTGCFLLV